MVLKPHFQMELDNQINVFLIFGGKCFFWDSDTARNSSQVIVLLPILLKILSWFVFSCLKLKGVTFLCFSFSVLVLKNHWLMAKHITILWKTDFFLLLFHSVSPFLHIIQMLIKALNPEKIYIFKKHFKKFVSLGILGQPKIAKYSLEIESCSTK